MIRTRSLRSATSVPALRRLMGAATALGIAMGTAMGIAVFGAASAQAADPQLIGTFGSWTAYSFQEGGNKVCYMAAQPRKAEGDYTRRGDIFALVTHRPGENSLNVVSIVAGYTYRDGSEADLRIGRTSFTLFTHGDRAWTRTSEADTQITEAIRKGSEMVVRGTSGRGTATTDTYSLSGSSAAYEAISRACNVPVR